MESGVISDWQISASSELLSHCGIASQGRLNLTKEAKGWVAAWNNGNQWLQVYLGSHCTRVSRVATQGRGTINQWITKYKLQFGNDGVNFQYYKEQGKATVKVNLVHPLKRL